MLVAFHKPESIDKTIQLLVRYGSKAKPIAGGTDVFVNYKSGKADIEHQVSLALLKELMGISRDDNGDIRIGAKVTLAELGKNEIIRMYIPVLAYAAEEVGCNSIRNRATIGGNLCNASPAGDIAPALIALNGIIEIIGPQGKRFIPAGDFFVGPGETVLNIDEIMVAVHVSIREKLGGSYIKLGIRKSMEISIASAACVVEAASDGTCTSARLVLGAVAPVPMLITECSELLEGKKLESIDAELIKQVAAMAEARTTPISDIRASAAYRKRMSFVLSQRAILSAIERIGW